MRLNKVPKFLRARKIRLKN